MNRWYVYNRVYVYFIDIINFLNHRRFGGGAHLIRVYVCFIVIINYLNYKRP